MNSLLSKTLGIFAISALIQTSALAQVLVTITTSTPLPPAPLNVAYSQTLSATGGIPPYTWKIISGALPQGLSLSTGGVISGTPVTVTGNFSVTVQASDSLVLSGQKTLTIDVPPVITTTSLPNGLVQSPYSAALSTVPPTMGTSLTWSVSTGSLPAGLSINASTGTISGTPTAAGTSNFTVKATDSASQSSTANLSLTIEPVLTIPAATLPVAVVGSAYVFQLDANGPPSPSWTVVSGILPPGITLSSSGSLSGTPTTPGSFTFTAQAATSNPTQTAQQSFILVVQSGITITTNSPLPLAVVSASYSTTIAATGPSTLTWTIITGSAPPGLSLTSTGALTGTPTTAGTYNFTVQVSSNTTPVQTATKALTIVVNPALTITTLPALPDAPLAGQYSVSVVATGGLQPYTWTVLGGGMPAGLTLSSAGVISGTPTSPGSFTFTAQVSDSFMPVQQVSRTFSITVTTTVTITTTSLPNAIQNAPYSEQLQATGTAPFFWAVTNGALPAGLTLSPGGLLQGTPTSPGSQTFTVSVTDLRSATSTKGFTLTVDPPIAALSVTLPPNLNPTQVVSDVTLTLAAPHPSAVTGQLIMEFSSTAEVAGDDPATEFSSGSRTVSFTIPANATTAVFPGPISLLTGTVAGSITMKANVDNGPSDVNVASSNVLLTAPQITNITAIRTTTGFDVQIVGYASARRVTSAGFIFDLQNGTKTSLSLNVDANFATWYKNPTSTQFGSTFSYVQSFNVKGDVTQILDVTVQLTNPQGSTTSAVVKLQ